jgi:hypothetical protein
MLVLGFDHYNIINHVNKDTSKIDLKTGMGWCELNDVCMEWTSVVGLCVSCELLVVMKCGMF